MTASATWRRKPGKQGHTQGTAVAEQRRHRVRAPGAGGRAAAEDAGDDADEPGVVEVGGLRDAARSRVEGLGVAEAHARGREEPDDQQERRAATNRDERAASSLRVGSGFGR